MTDTPETEWTSLLVAEDIPPLAAALKPFSMYPGYRLGDTGQFAVRIYAKKGDRTAAERILAGLHALSPHVLPRMPGSLWFSIDENSTGRASHFQLFLDIDLAGAQILRSDMQDAAIVFMGNPEEAVGYITENLTYSRALERRMRLSGIPSP